MSSSRLKNMVLTAFFIALALLLPFLTGQIPQIGSMLSPMHIPVLLCGFICGWPWGLIAGLVSPILRSVTFGMPPLMPTALAIGSSSCQPFAVRCARPTTPLKAWSSHPAEPVNSR